MVRCDLGWARFRSSLPGHGEGVADAHAVIAVEHEGVRPRVVCVEGRRRPGRGIKDTFLHAETNSSRPRFRPHREDDPWYPTMRIYRQNVHMAWGPVFKRSPASRGSGGPRTIFTRVSAGRFWPRFPRKVARGIIPESQANSDGLSRVHRRPVRTVLPIVVVCSDVTNRRDILYTSAGHTNPKRQRGRQTITSLTLRVSGGYLITAAQYNSPRLAKIARNSEDCTRGKPAIFAVRAIFVKTKPGRLDETIHSRPVRSGGSSDGVRRHSVFRPG